MYCALRRGEIIRSAQIAQACNSSANHLAHVVNILHGHGFVRATRGRQGGVTLARDPGEINIGDVFLLFEADVPFTECRQVETNTCPLVPACRLRLAVGRALDAFYDEMSKVTLADLVGGNTELDAIFTVTEAGDTFAGRQERSA